jgi:hypothetical protein
LRAQAITAARPEWSNPNFSLLDSQLLFQLPDLQINPFLDWLRASGSQYWQPGLRRRQNGLLCRTFGFPAEKFPFHIFEHLEQGFFIFQHEFCIGVTTSAFLLTHGLQLVRVGLPDVVGLGF